MSTSPVSKNTSIRLNKLALIVDDEKIHRHILRSFLTKLGYEVIEASNGLDGVNLFIENLPDFIFMDVMMPIMDGLEAALIIKTNTNGKFTPIIFLTALGDPIELQRCIEVGGDDFLTKPLNIKLLNTRIIALERTRDLYNKLHSQHLELIKYLDNDKDNQIIAHNILQNAILPRNETTLGIKCIIKPASTFCGDMLLCGPVANKSYRLMLADFTGHGLASAMVSIPVSEIFHAMRLKGKDQIDVLNEINIKLCQLLPDDRFMAATIIDISLDKKHLTIWSGGMPNTLILRNEEITNLAVKGLPLGIIDNYDFVNDQINLDCIGNERILLISDGFLELKNYSNELLLSSVIYKHFLRDWQQDKVRLEDLIEITMSLHTKDRPQDDDISIIELNLCFL